MTSDFIAKIRDAFALAELARQYASSFRLIRIHERVQFAKLKKARDAARVVC